MTMHMAPRYAVKDTSRVDDQLEIKAIADALAGFDGKIKSFVEKASADIANSGKVASETKSALDKFLADAQGLQARMLEVEQKLARRAPGAGPAQKSLGAQLTETDGFKALASSGRGTARLNVKTTITSGIYGSESPQIEGGAGDLIRPDRLPGIIQPAQRTFTIRDLLLPGRTSSNAIEFPREVGFVNRAATVEEGATKPESTIGFTLESVNVRTIAHWIPASKQVLADVPMLQSYVDARLRYGLKLEEENQLLTGNNVGQNLHGLVPQATDFNTGLSQVGDTAIDTIRRAILQVRLAELAPNFVVLNPIDWADIELTKDGEERYLIVPNVQVGAQMVLWRLAVVETTAMTSGEFLVGAGAGAQVFDREEAAVEVSTDHSDFFVRNLVAIRAEERLALAMFRPESFVHGSLG
jgi:HK97 family phage major capsid protein